MPAGRYLSAVSVSYWDLALLSVVTLQATAIAYLPRPRWKALVLSLPFPFTALVLSQGQPVGTSQILALVLLLLFFHGIRLLHQRLPIVPALACGLVGYILLSHLLLKTAADLPFWPAALAASALALALYFLHSPRTEPDHRTPLPIYLKLPAIGAIVGLLLLIKESLQGFATLFPILGVIGSYEARKGLWTVCRQVPVLMTAMCAMLAAIYTAQDTCGLAGGLLISWAVYLAVLWPLTLRLWTQDALAPQRT